MAGLEGFPAEMLLRKKSISLEGTGEPSSGNARPLCINEELEAIGKTIANTAKKSNEKLTAILSGLKPRIHKVPELLRKIGSNNKHFDPELVSIGPYHYGEPHLEVMEEHKKAAAMRFFNGCGSLIDEFYTKVRDVASEARNWYAYDFGFNNEEFTTMMFFDGCFVLHFIDSIEKNRMDELTMGVHLRGFIMRDTFLFENQLPFIVLEVLMKLKPIDLEGFIKENFGVSAKSKGDEPHHLLDLLHTKLLGDRSSKKANNCCKAPWRSFRSAMELNEVGIRFKSSGTRCLRDIGFQPGFIHGWLSLPEIVIDDLTRSRFLNLIAFEMCPNATLDYGITSYICFLDYLIDHAVDVKELRLKGILFNFLGSDQQVADLFNELVIGLAPDHGAYEDVIKGIDKHYQNKIKVSTVKMLQTHFSSPWTTIGFLAAALLLLLTLIQAIFQIFLRK